MLIIFSQLFNTFQKFQKNSLAKVYGALQSHYLWHKLNLKKLHLQQGGIYSQQTISTNMFKNVLNHHLSFSRRK